MRTNTLNSKIAHLREQQKIISVVYLLGTSTIYSLLVT